MKHFLYLFCLSILLNCSKSIESPNNESSPILKTTISDKQIAVSGSHAYLSPDNSLLITDSINQTNNTRFIIVENSNKIKLCSFKDIPPDIGNIFVWFGDLNNDNKIDAIIELADESYYSPLFLLSEHSSSYSFNNALMKSYIEYDKLTQMVKLENGKLIVSEKEEQYSPFTISGTKITFHHLIINDTLFYFPVFQFSGSNVHTLFGGNKF